MEAEPSEPIFDEAPKRLRFFLLETLKQSFYPNDARSVVARVFCKPEFLVDEKTWPARWQEMHLCIASCRPPEIYNLIEAIYAALKLASVASAILFQDDVNRVFGEESIGWLLDDHGILQRTLPALVQEKADQFFKELEAPRVLPALSQVKSARDAYNARPRSDLDVCTNIFDAMESVAKEVFALPTGSFGQVLKLQQVRDTFRHS